MKRLLISAALLLCSLLTFAQFSGTLSDAQGVKYTANQDETTCYVSKHENDYSATITIPDFYEGRRVTSIGNGAFYGCSNLTSLTIPSSVTTIGEKAFSGCSSLTSLTIPSSVTSIGYAAFEKCSSLTSLTIPSSVTSIGNGAFYGCNSLTSLTIPSSVTSISKGAFSNCSSLTSLTISEGVTSIGEYAFERCSSLTSLTIPSSVSSIGNKAFNGCSSLTSLTISEGVTSIGDRAFYGCSGLKTLTIPSSVTSIGYRAFNNCSSLTSLTISEGVTSIGDYAFYGCSGLKTLTISEGVTLIGDYAFNNCIGLKTLTIPSSVTSIGYRAFNNCSGLSSVIVKWATPIEISTDVFYDVAILVVPKGSKALYEVINGWKRRFNNIIEPFDGTLTDEQGIRYTANDDECTCRVSGHDDYYFYDDNYDVKITIPEMYEGRWVTSIGSNAFSGWSELTSVTTPSTLTSIDENAFNGCKSITSLNVDWETPPAISARAFNNSNYMDATLYVPVDSKSLYENADVWKDFKVIVGCFRGTVVDSQGVKYTANEDRTTCYVSGYNDQYSNIIIPEFYDGCKVTSIGDHAFVNCSNLTSVAIPSSVMSIEYAAFRDCSGMVSLTIPEGVTEIYGSAFENCSNLTSVTIPEGVTVIGGFAFRGCSSLTSLTIPASVMSIGSSAFSGCSGLTSLTIPSSVTSIAIGNYYAFKGCSGLQTIIVEEGNSVYDSRENCNAIIKTSNNTLIVGCQNTVIPASVTSIGASAFASCSSLTSVSIPANVTSIGGSAFQGCSGLTSVTIPASLTSIGGSAFDGCNGLQKIIVEEGNSVYDSRDNCNAIIKFDNTLVVGCQNTIIPSSVTSIGEGAFRGCSSLTSVTIPSSVTSIELGAFEYCSNLTSLTISNSVTSIGNYAFQDCIGLTSVTIPESVTSIGGGVFRGCSSLTSVTVEWSDPIGVSSDAFSKKDTLYVPIGTRSLYEAADGWKDFQEIIEMPFSFNTPDASVCLRQKIKLPIELMNNEEVVAYQFDLTLPEGFTLAKDSKGQFLVKKTNRYDDENQILNVTQLENGDYRFVCFSMEKGKITGTSGPVLNVFVTMDHDMELGDYQGTISNIVLTKVDQQQKKLKTATFGITVNDLAEGDSNGDGEQNVSDIVEIVNFIMERPSERFVFRTADLNGDNEVNVTDVVMLVDIIMAPDPSRGSERTITVNTDNDWLALSGGNGQPFGLWLTNEAGYVASQFDIRLSAGQTLESVSLNGSRADGHQLTFEKITAGLYRVVVFSQPSSSYRGNSGELMNISVKGQGNVSIENILFVTDNATEKHFADLNSSTTAIGVAKLTEPADVYTTDGRMVRRQATSLDGLKKGVYIINGKKEIVR